MSDGKHLDPNPDEQPTLDIEQITDDLESLAEQIVLPADPPKPKSAERITVTMDDLFEDDDSDPDDEDTLPPVPLTLDDDEMTGTAPVVLPTPDAVDTPPIGNPQPQFTPTKRPPVTDAGATQVNPKVALPKRGLATRDSHGRSAEEVRRQRRIAREAAERKRREREQQTRPSPPQPTQRPPRQQPPPQRPPQRQQPARPPARDLSHNTNRVA